MIGLISIAVSGMCKSLMDLSSEGNLNTKDEYYIKSKSWKHKWKLDSTNEPIVATKTDNKCYLGIKRPQYVERFPFSSTILVSFTDFWHLIQHLFLSTLVIGGILYEPLEIDNYILMIFVNYVIVLSSLLIPFELLYAFLKKRKK